MINGYIFYFLGQLFSGQLFELFARETNLKKQNSVVRCMYLHCSSNNLILVATFDNDTQLDLCKHPPQFHDQIG